MLFSVAIFDYTTYTNIPNANEFGLYLLASFPENSTGFNLALDKYVNDALASNTPLVLMSAGNVTWNSDTDASLLRTNE